MKPFYPTKSEIATLLEGTQTALVRPLSPQPDENARLPESGTIDGWIDCGYKSPFGPPGTILWCKEEWWSDWKDKVEKEPCYAYKQSYGDIGVQWNHAVSMPKSACRLWLEVVDVKVCKWIDITVKEVNQAGFESGIGVNQVSFKSLFCDWIWYASVKRIEKPAST